MTNSQVSTHSAEPSWKIFVKGVLCEVIAITFCIGGAMLVYSTIAMELWGVNGKATVQKYLGEVHVRRNGLSWTNHDYILAFDGRTLQRQCKDKYPLGAAIDIIYVPGTNNMEFIADRWSPVWSILAGVGILLVGVLFGMIGYLFIAEALGWMTIADVNPDAGLSKLTE
jgi:hypothetical protein